MKKTGPILLNLFAVVVCGGIGLVCLSDGHTGQAAFHLTLATLNAATIVWLCKQKNTR